MKSNSLIPIITVIIAVLFLPSIVVGMPVPWYSEDNHAHGDASIYNSIAPSGDSDADDVYSPPLPLPITAFASVTDPLSQSATGSSAITSSQMSINTYAFDSYGSDSYADANAVADFTGSFVATHDLFQFSYSFRAIATTDCTFGSSTCDSYTSGYLYVKDLTDSTILLDDLLFSANAHYGGSAAIGDLSETLSRFVPLTVGHEFEVGLEIIGNSYASGLAAEGSSDITFQYNTSVNTANPIPEPSTMILLGSGLLGLVGLRKKFKK